MTPISAAQFAVVALGGGLGAMLRYGLSTTVSRSVITAFPAGTLAVNVLGCLLMGLLMGFIEYRSSLGPQTRLLLTTGLLGSLTTFSAVGFETFDLMRRGLFGMAFGNMGANLLIGMAAVAVGWSLAKIGVL